MIKAKDAHEAMIYYRQQTFDLIILDIQMPDIDGTELLAMMREEKPDDKTPVTALTANILYEEAERLINFGFDFYLSKPIDKVKLKAILDGTGVQKDTIDIADEPVDGTVGLKTLDLEISLRLSASNMPLLHQTLEILLREIPIHQNQLVEALAESDYAKISMIIHKIHGITCYASLPKIQHQVRNIQRLMSTNIVESIDDPVREIIDELEKIKVETLAALHKATETAK